jgi:hypothetical protein
MNSTICVDLGNYSTLIATVSGREVSPITKMRSLIYDSTHNGECRNGIHTDESPMVEIGGRFYKIGAQAKNFPGFLTAVEGGKTREDIFLPILLSSLPTGFEGIARILVPSRNNLKESLISFAVVGMHTFTVYKNGRKVDSVANITGCEFHRESDAGARYAYESGAINPEDVVLAVDIGGGTCNFLVASYDLDGNFEVRFNKSLDNSGGIALAQSLANTDLVKSYGRVLEIAKIMDAITSGKRYIANRRDLTFEPVWEDCVNQWFNSLISRIMSASDKYLDEVTSIVWFGGGAEILRERLEKTGHIVLDNSQFANLNELIRISKTPLLQIAAA